MFPFQKKKYSSSSIISARNVVIAVVSWITILSSLFNIPVVHAALVECNTTQYCQSYFNSTHTECIPNSNDEDDISSSTSSAMWGTCSNPFLMGGCLYNMKPGWNQIRVCNSDDLLTDAPEQGYCRLPSEEMNYQEIRILSQNWESAFILAWIQQILLMEVLNVPTTMETGLPNGKVQFYDYFTHMDFGTSNDFGALQTATELQGDCLQASSSSLSSTTASSSSSETTTTEESSLYRTCAHLNPEVWKGQLKYIQSMVDEEYIESSIGNGALGQQSWFVPKLSARKDPALLSYLGISGEENREKMATTFLWPTTWKQYCQDYSIDNCTIPDTTAKRYPTTDEENALYYSKGQYRGYFRFTDANNCTLHPNSCHGHMADYPCGWSSYAKPQAYYNQIAIEPVKYSYGELTQIWAAANETSSDLLLHWWTPEALYQKMVTTEFELLRISLPPPNQDCIEARVTPQDRCTDDVQVQLGDPLGACEEPSFPLQKVLSKSLYQVSKGSHIPVAKQSPAYDTMKSFTINDFQLGKIFDYWLERGDRPTSFSNYDLRYATCRWVVENFDYLQTFVPRTHPRILENKSNTMMDTFSEPLNIVAFVLGLVSTVLIVMVAGCVYRQRNRRVMQNAQIEFLSILLVGLVLVALASLCMTIPPRNWTCITITWLFNVGYTFELVPLVVKVAAIARMMQAAKKCRRVLLERNDLFRTVAGLCMVVIFFLLLWTSIDPPQRQVEFQLTNRLTPDGSTIVTTTSYCRSKSVLWRYSSVTWHILMLVTATVLTFQTRKLQHGINECQVLAILIYSHFFFVVLRVITFLLEDSIGDSTATIARSILLSADIIATASIYFLPKLLSSDNDSRRQRGSLIVPSKDSYDDVGGKGNGEYDGRNSFMMQPGVVAAAFASPVPQRNSLSWQPPLQSPKMSVGMSNGGTNPSTTQPETVLEMDPLDDNDEQDVSKKYNNGNNRVGGGITIKSINSAGEISVSEAEVQPTTSSVVEPSSPTLSSLGKVDITTLSSLDDGEGLVASSNEPNHEDTKTRLEHSEPQVANGGLSSESGIRCRHCGKIP